MYVSDRTPHQIRIEQFMKLAGQDLPTQPTIPTVEVRRLRASLIFEEAMETIRALGFKVSARNTEIDNLDEYDWDFKEWEAPNIVEVADGCADISVVTVGTLSAFGLSDRRLFEIVDESNLAKFGPGGYKREDGKWIKPPDWVKPDIEGLLHQMSQF